MEYLGIPVIEDLDLSVVPPNSMRKFWAHLIDNGLAQPVYAPVMVARGAEPKPVLGVTALVHGNEVNGLAIVQRLFAELDASKLRGTVVGVPAVNIPATLSRDRFFNDGYDLNRIMPGKERGNMSKHYAWQAFHKIINHFDYLIDLHTASFGRINSHYIRADFASKIALHMARLQNAQIILDTKGHDGTLRGAATEAGIGAITVEVGDPNRFQKGMIHAGLTGIYNTLSFLNMIERPISPPGRSAVVCRKSYWLHTDVGGILVVLPGVTEHVKRGQLIAVQKDVFGEIIREYDAPEDGIVIGKHVQPVSQSGGRILHLGVVK